LLDIGYNLIFSKEGVLNNRKLSLEFNRQLTIFRDIEGLKDIETIKNAIINIPLLDKNKKFLKMKNLKLLQISDDGMSIALSIKSKDIKKIKDGLNIKGELIENLRLIGNQIIELDGIKKEEISILKIKIVAERFFQNALDNFKNINIVRKIFIKDRLNNYDLYKAIAAAA
jgi:hypothetical protein